MNIVMNRAAIVEELNRLSDCAVTFLSPSVRKLIVEKGIACQPETADALFQQDSTSHEFEDSFRIIASSLLLINGTHKDSSVNEHNDEWYRENIEKIAPHFGSIHKRMNQLVLHRKLQDFKYFTAWMHQLDTVDLCIELISESAPDSHHECLLHLTAALERALGNVYVCISKKKKAPSLMKDLLASEELRALLGDSLTVPLQLLMGSPASLNVRNLVWHGFVNCGEIDSHRYASVLLFLCAAIGCRLEKESIVPRRFVTLPQFPKWFDWCERSFIDAVEGARALSACRRLIWRRSLELHFDGCYGRSSALLLPEIENYLRLMYCAVNGCPNRIMTAETSVHYTTLDVILDKDNDLKSFLGEALYSALLDAVIEPGGPRIRDRLSHGECEWAEVEASTSWHLLSIALLLLRRSHADDQCPDYSPIFSPAALFKHQLQTTLQVVGRWIQFCNTDCDPAVSGVRKVQPFRASSSFILEWLEDWTIATHQRLIDQISVPRNTPFNGTWRRVLYQLMLGCQRMTECLTEYRKSPPELRSRQRSTRDRLESHLALFVRAVRYALLFPLADALPTLGPAIINNDDIKMRKRVVCWADNFASASAVHRWMELAQLAQQFLQAIKIVQVDASRAVSD